MLDSLPACIETKSGSFFLNIDKDYNTDKGEKQPFWRILYTTSDMKGTLYKSEHEDLGKALWEIIVKIISNQQILLCPNEFFSKEEQARKYFSED